MRPKKLLLTLCVTFAACGRTDLDLAEDLTGPITPRLYGQIAQYTLPGEVTHIARYDDTVSLTYGVLGQTVVVRIGLADRRGEVYAGESPSYYRYRLSAPRVDLLDDGDAVAFTVWITDPVSGLVSAVYGRYPSDL